MNTITIPRLWMWVPNEGWRPAAMAGVSLTAQEWREKYRARNACTFWINTAEEREAKLEAKHAAIRNRAA